MPGQRTVGQDQGYYDWSPITNRKALKWPGGARVALVVIVNLEHWDWQLPPDVPGAPTGPFRGPIAEYSHSEGEAVMGGYVYRGTAIPGLAGAYVFGDYISGTMWELVEAPAGTWTRTMLLSTGLNMSSFGQDVAGELYLVDYGGNVLKLAAQ